MELTHNGASFIKSWEKCRLTAYPDPKTGGRPYTIGWGRAYGVVPGQTCTQAQADAWFLEDVRPALEYLDRRARKPLTAQMIDALCSWIFNCGPAKVDGATLWLKLNAGDYKGAADQLLRWDSPGTPAQAGLDLRRAAERDIFLSGHYVLHN